MQIMKNKKVWFFLLLGMMAVTTIYLWRLGINETKVYTNGRVVEKQPGKYFVVCQADTDMESEIA